MRVSKAPARDSIWDVETATELLLLAGYRLIRCKDQKCQRLGPCWGRGDQTQSAATIPALCRGLSFSNLTFSKEFTKTGFLFVGKIR
jgi:hypothetical protein